MNIESQNIESYWAKMKKYLRAMEGAQKTKISDYLLQFR